MSKEDLVKLMQAAAKDEQLKARLQNARSYEEVKRVAQQLGCELGDLNELQAWRALGVVTGRINEPLTSEELELVAAGLDGHIPIRDPDRGIRRNEPFGVYGDAIYE